MPELPDIELYLHALRPRIVGQRLERVRLASPFLLRSVDPPLEQIHGRTVKGLRRLGKRVVWEMGDELFLVIHLMIAGRFGDSRFVFPSGRILWRFRGVRKKIGRDWSRVEERTGDTQG